MVYAWCYSAHLHNGRLASACGTRKVHLHKLYEQAISLQALLGSPECLGALGCMAASWHPRPQSSLLVTLHAPSSTLLIRIDTRFRSDPLIAEPQKRRQTGEQPGVPHGTILCESTSHPTLHDGLCTVAQKGRCHAKASHQMKCRDATASAAGGSRQACTSPGRQSLCSGGPLRARGTPWRVPHAVPAWEAGLEMLGEVRRRERSGRAYRRCARSYDVPTTRSPLRAVDCPAAELSVHMCGTQADGGERLQVRAGQSSHCFVKCCRLFLSEWVRGELFGSDVRVPGLKGW